MKLIDKSALVAEINRVLNSYDPNEITSGRYALVNLRNFINTLEVKELDEKSVTSIDVTRFYNDGLRCGVEAFARIVRMHLCEMTADSLIQFRNEYRKLTGDELFGEGKD